MTERQSLGLAFALHAALFAALSFWVRLPSPLPSISETSIEVVDVADAPAVRAERPAETPAPPPPSPSEAQPDPVSEPVAEPTPPAPALTPAPVPPPRPVDDRPAQDAVAEIAAKQAKPAPPKPAPSKPSPSLDTDRLASLIGKAKPRDARPAAPAPSAPATARDSSAFARSVARAIPAAGRMDARTAANLEGAIRAQIAPCWNPPVGGADVATMTVVLRIRLGRDGTVAAPPVLVSQTGETPGNAAYARAFADTARRAVLRCAPIKLPPELFDYWREFELNFDPKLMT